MAVIRRQRVPKPPAKLELPISTFTALAKREPSVVKGPPKPPQVTDNPYRQLDSEGKQIRLLAVRKGCNDDPVRCTLEHVCLLARRKPSYETVSYVWGDSTKRGSIFLHGRETDVPASTEEVLRRMRQPDRTRVLWIDAVCINHTGSALRGIEMIMDLEIVPTFRDGRSLVAFVKDAIKSRTYNESSIPAGVDQTALTALLSRNWFRSDPKTQRERR